MERRKLTKEDIDEVRDIDGFPNTSDYDIVKMSEPPFYTSCPNPFIEEFIEKNGTHYDDTTDDYHIEPYTKDVSVDKHDLIYNIHTYHTKVPPKAIKTYLEHYTKPGDLILDGFAGSGMTGIAAQTCDSGKRNAILIDLSSYATFVSSQYNTPLNDEEYDEMENILRELKEKFGSLYKTKHIHSTELNLFSDSLEGTVNYTIWSDIYICPVCGSEMIYYDAAYDSDHKKAYKSIKCHNCGAEHKKSELILKKINTIDSCGNVVLKGQKVPVLINYSIGTKRYFKKPDDEDLEKLKTIRVSKFVPKNPLPDGYNLDQPKKSHGYTTVDSFYTDRTQLILSEYLDKCNSNKSKFLFTSTLPKLTLLNRYMPEHGSRALVGPMVGTYYVPALSVENNVIQQFEFQLKKLGNLRYKKGNVIVSTQSTTDLSNINNNTIDYIFIDPPFGANIMYSELNFLVESWLGVHSSNEKEAIINNVQRKALPEYALLMTDCLKELYRVLKPNRWITIEFHNSKNSVWNAIQEAILKAGFVIADVRTLNKEKKTVMQYKSDYTVDQDLVISAYKPKKDIFSNELVRFDNENAVWEFVNQHLSNLSVVTFSGNKIEINPERQAILLFDRMVSYHIVNGYSVPMDATDFYKELDNRYIKRDGMYFLPNQVNEYDNARITAEVENIQLTLFVSNEKSAIAWLYQQLDKNCDGPQTYSELQPKFMKEVKSVEKYEKIPELQILLEENFLQDDNDKWYIPDRTKEADVAKLREKNLWKEFEGYMNSKGKLKLFRSEAIRVGFARLWKDKNYQAIVEIAERLPEKIVQEDPNILMYYDISLSRV